MHYLKYTDVGAVREENEDSILGLALHGVRTIYVFAVADGVGGGYEGKYASNLTVSYIERYLKDVTLPRVGYLKHVQSIVLNAIEKANEVIYTTMTAKNKGSGTTLTVLITDGVSYNYVHLGDTRLYEFKSDFLNQVTKDDTWVQLQVEKGSMTLEQAEKHPRRHQITKAIGVSKRILPLASENIPVTGLFVLTSDGFSEKLKSADISGVLNNTNTLERIANRMMSEGQRDNLSIILVKF